MVPGGASPGTDYDKAGQPTHVRAADIAALGLCAVHYDPSGRGRSQGEEDHWGPRHQEELLDVIAWARAQPEADGALAGVVSFSIGVTIAAGALARDPTWTAANVGWLFDWEGPSNRRVITLDDTHPPLKEFPCSDDVFWREREAVRFMGDVACGYARYQAAADHVQGERTDHAVELVNAALRGRAAWVRLNGRELREPLDEAAAAGYPWLADENNHRGAILACLLDALERAGQAAGPREENR
jgi:hypothetical protein